MSNFQTNTLFGAILIAILWLIFCIRIIHIDAFVGVLGALSSLFMGLWIGRNQKRVGFVGSIGILLTALGFIFSAIPVYNATPSLATFYATQIPSIQCDQSIAGYIMINDAQVSMSDICKRGSFPIIIQQHITPQTDAPILINLGMGNSILLPPSTEGIVARSTGNEEKSYILQTTSPLSTGSMTLNQVRIARQYADDKKSFLQKNYPWKREHAPSITKIAIRKMRLLGLIDRSYHDKITHLEFYMREVTE